MLESFGPYEIARTLHVVTATLFAGGMASDLVAHAVSRARFDPQATRFLFGKFLFADSRITPVFIVLLLATGFWLIWTLGLNPIETPWIGGSLLLFALSGAAFGVRLMPLQKAVVALAEPWSSREPTQDELSRLATLDRNWNRWALVIGALTFAVLLLMVVRPS